MQDLSTVNTCNMFTIVFVSNYMLACKNKSKLFQLATQYSTVLPLLHAPFLAANKRMCVEE